MQKYTFKNGHTVIVEHIKPKEKQTQSFTVVYTHGFCSDPWGRKPEVVKKWCLAHGCGFFRYEIAGHGEDVSRFEETTINTYKSQIFEIVRDLIDGDIIVMGASLGGWLSLLAAIEFPQKVIGFIGLAAAPDFLKTYFENYFKPEHKEILDTAGKLNFSTGNFTYTITKQMIDSAEENLLLNKEKIFYEGKVRLIQGMQDESLDWRTALKLAAKLTGNDVKTILLKSSNHQLGEEQDLIEIERVLDDFLEVRD